MKHWLQGWSAPTIDRLNKEVDELVERFKKNGCEIIKVGEPTKIHIQEDKEIKTVFGLTIEYYGERQKVT